MSHFYGSVQGNRGVVTRGGSKNSGYSSTVASWEGSVRVNGFYNEEKGEDWVTISLAAWRGVGNNVTIYQGPISGVDVKKFIKG